MNITRTRLSALALLVVLTACTEPTAINGLDDTAASPAVADAAGGNVAGDSAALNQGTPPRVSATNIGALRGEQVITPYATVTLAPTDQVALVQLAFTAFDENGAVLATQSGNNAVVRAGVPTLMLVQMTVPDSAAVTRIEAKPSVHMWAKDRQPGTTLATTGIAVRDDEFLGLQITGQVITTYAQPPGTVTVAATCMDKGGRVIAAGFNYPTSDVSAQAPAAFQITGGNRVKASSVAQCTVTAAPFTFDDTTT